MTASKWIDIIIIVILFLPYSIVVGVALGYAAEWLRVKLTDFFRKGSP